MILSPHLIGRGFADPILGAQFVFRTVMQALSRPGIPQNIPSLGVHGPKNVHSNALCILLSLCDPETPVWLDADFRGSELEPWLKFHCNCPIVDEVSQASFALYGSSSHNPNLEEFAQGDPRYPERSTTLIVLISSMKGGPSLQLSGPGIPRTVDIQPQGLSSDFVDQFIAQHSLFPLGVDCIIVSPEEIMGLPRTTQITRKSL